MRNIEKAYLGRLLGYEGLKLFLQRDLDGGRRLLCGAYLGGCVELQGIGHGGRGGAEQEAP